MFGVDTALEHTPLLEALALELDSQGAEEVRLYLGGSASDWAINEWPAASVIYRCRANSIKVIAIVSEEGLAALPWDVANAVRHFLGGVAAEIRVASEKERQVSNAWRICEVVRSVVDGSEVRAWAVTEASLTAPGAAWGIPSANQTVLKGTVASTIVGKPAGPEVLVQPIPGSYREFLFDDIAKSLSEVGEGFWRTVAAKAPQLQRLLETRTSLTHFAYSDRYITSPLTARVLYEIVSTLSKRGAVGPATTVSIATTYKSPNSFPNRLFDNWSKPQDQQAVLVALLQTTGVSQVNVELTSALDHMREMSLTFAGEQMITVRLDHGITFLESVGVARFDFSASVQTQTRALAKLDVRVKPRKGLVAVGYVKEG